MCNKQYLHDFLEKEIQLGRGQEPAIVDIQDLCAPCGMRNLPHDTILVLDVIDNEIIAHLAETL